MEIKMVTGNSYKLNEITGILSEYDIKVRGLDLPTEEIQSKSLRRIVLHKALSIMELMNPIYIVEDSGLFITALNDFPGPYSKYIYESIGCKGILKLMRGVEDRTAVFRTVVAAVILPNTVKLFEGEVSGHISRVEKGEYGFGFDPIFIPEGMNKTLAEVEMEEKNKVSHRGAAFRKLAEYLRKIM